MRLTVLGCSGSVGGLGAACSGYLLTLPGHRPVLVDCGPGVMGELQRLVDPNDVDVVLSHLHADHCLDLCGYYVMRKYHPRGPQPRIPVWGPSGTAERMARAGFGPSSRPAPSAILDRLRARAEALSRRSLDDCPDGAETCDAATGTDPTESP